VERFNLRKISETGFREEYQIKFSKRFADLQNLNHSDEINRILENNKKSIKSSSK